MDETIESKRNAIKKAYNGNRWREMVDRMSDAQVIALYLKFKAQGRI